VLFGKCHNRYTHEVVSKFQSQRRRLREMTSMRRSDLAFRPLRQRRKKSLEESVALSWDLTQVHSTVKSFPTLTSESGKLGQSYCTCNATTKPGRARSALLNGQARLGSRASPSFTWPNPLTLSYIPISFYGWWLRTRGLADAITTEFGYCIGQTACSWPSTIKR